MTFTVMVIDDDPNLRVLLRQMLAFRGFEVVEAENGQDALDTIGNLNIDLVLLDVMMPVLDGVSTCKALRSNPDYADLPILMLSGKVNSEAVKEGMAAGATKYLFKPISLKRLIAEVRAVLPVQIS